MPARLSALLVWALVAISAMAWGLHLFARGPTAPANTVTVGDSVVAGGDLTRLLGAAPVAVATAVPVPAMASRFQLTGVVAPRAPDTQGIALIAVDGHIPRAYRVGARIDGDLALQAVDRRSASIGAAGGAAAVVLEMPPMPVAATGMLMPARGDPPVNTYPLPQAPPMQAPTMRGTTPPLQSMQQPLQQPQVQLGVQPGLNVSNPPPGGEPPHTVQQDDRRRLQGATD